MREWPKLPHVFDINGLSCGLYWSGGVEQKLDYERARADAAMERLRICANVLMDVRDNAYTLEDAIGYAKEALAAIGPLPEEGERK